MPQVGQFSSAVDIGDPVPHGVRPPRAGRAEHGGGNARGMLCAILRNASWRSSPGLSMRRAACRDRGGTRALVRRRSGALGHPTASRPGR